MKKIMIAFIFLCTTNLLISQIVSWPLTTDGNPTNVASNISAGLFTKGSGLNAVTFGTNGASCSGWTTNNSIDTSDYFQVSVSAQTGYKLAINTIAFSERRSLSGIHAYELRISKTPNFSTYTTLATVTVPDNDLVRDGTITGLNILVLGGETLYIRWYGYQAESGSGTWRIQANTLSLNGTITPMNTNDNDSYASQPTQQVPSDTITSTITHANLAKRIFSFTLNDPGTSDGLPTKVSLLSIKNYLTNNWQTIFKGAFIKVNNTNISPIQTTINQNSITFQFSEGSLTIPNQGNVTVDLFVYLKDSGLVDQTPIQCYVDPTSFDSYLTGSAFSLTFPAIVSNTFTIEVIATKIHLLSEPALIIPTIPFEVQAEVTDANGNRDITFSGSLSIQLILGSGNLQSLSGLTQSVNSGLVFWNDVTYNQPDIIQFSITDNNSQLQAAYSQYIYSVNPPNPLFDDFNDGNFTQNPTWIGDNGDFIINTSYQLELNTVVSGSPNYSYLTTPVKLTSDTTEWQAWIKLDFSPSSNNHAKYYLISNNQDLTKPLKGYYLQIGEDGTNDALRFYYQDSLTSTLLSTGTLGNVANNPTIRVKVIRTASGEWKIYADYVGGSAFALENTIQHSSFYDTLSFTGIICKYSSSYAKNKFFFDDFYVGPLLIDTIKPTLTELIVIDSLHLDLLFSEAISLSTAQDINNYNVNNGIGVPVSAVRDNLNAALIHLTFSAPFVSGQQYTIAFFNLTDLSNNLIPQPLATNFMWYYPKMFDVVINEIMADPSPAYQLPEYEYIELYNRSSFDLELKDWTFTVNNTTTLLPTYKLEAGKYVLLAHSSAVNALQSYGNVLPVLSSTTSLTNSGAALQLSYKDGKLIHHVTYTDNWYQDSNKDDGGWSLEMIDPNNPCGNENNWKASISPLHGTPGSQNSVFASNADTQIPDVIRAILTDTNTIIVTFSETIMDNILSSSNFTVSHNIGNPDSVYFYDINRNKIVLTFPQAIFNPDTIYYLIISAGVKDCAGNTTNTELITRFGKGKPINPGDIVINEVLFYEPTGGTDYVELYNNSDKLFDLKDLKLSTLDADSISTSVKDLTTEGYYLFPRDYVVVTKSLQKVQSFYYTPYPKKVLEMPDFPSLKSTGDRLTFVNQSYEIIDDFSFNEGMHFQLLNSFKGIALERIYPSLPTQDQKSWHSAAQQVGFGTPTYQNSQYSLFKDFEGEIVVEPEVFSPDLDGKDDNLTIHYHFPEPGYVANVNIFDAKGRLIRKLIRNELCGTTGYFVWDGLTDAKTKAEIGIYIVYIEVFNLNGKSKSFKKTCVVGGYLK